MNIFKKEKDVTDLALQYLAITEDCVRSTGHALEAYLDDRIEQANELSLRASELESTADQLRRDIGDKLYSGAYLPLIRGDIYSLIESLDRVPNAGEACSSFFLGEKPEIPDELKEKFRDLTRESISIIDLLHEAVRGYFSPTGKVEDIRENCKAVGVQESKVDGMQWDMTVEVFESSLNLALKQHLQKAIDRIGHITDRAEDAAEQLELTAVKSIL